MKKEPFVMVILQKALFINGIIIIDIYFHIKYNVDTHKEKVIL